MKEWCHYCLGTGRQPVDDGFASFDIPCTGCDGTGYFEIPENDPPEIEEDTGLPREYWWTSTADQ